MERIETLEPCPYLPDRQWRSLVIDAGESIPPEQHRDFLDLGFRRMGKLFFRPNCPTCDACRPMRVDVARWRPTKSQRRARNRNRDLTIEVGEPVYEDEKRELLSRYLAARHVGPMTAEEEALRRWMYDPVAGSRELIFRHEGRLVGVSLFDRADDILSSIYFWFDPEETRRSMGIFSMVVEIEIAREQGLRWYHPGFLVRGCPAMEYKARFGPAELLDDFCRWRPIELMEGR